MPKAGFKSITVKENVYDNFFKTFQMNKKELKSQGINTFTSYIVSRLETVLRDQELKAKHKARFECISIENNRAILKDNDSSMIVEIVKENRILKCVTCNNKSCRHIGFAMSLHKLYPIMD